MPFDQIVAESVERARKRFRQDISEQEVAGWVGKSVELQYADDEFGRGAGAVAFITGYAKYVHYDGEQVAAVCYGLLTDEGMEYALANGLQLSEIDADDLRMHP